MDKTSYIAVFDSGVGGVSVLRELMRLMPNENFYYFGDSANAPYGLKTTNQVWSLTVSAARKLLDGLDAKAMVVACNTATAAAVHDLRSIWPEKIIIGIEPALKLACDLHPGGTIGIMATEVTLREKKLAALLARYSGNCTVLRLPSPGIVELVEAGKADSPEALALMEEELGHLRGKLDALVLGCTHYPFATETIRKILGEDVPLFDGGEGTAREARRRLEAAGLLRDGQGEVVWENSLDDPDILALSKQLLEHD